MKKQLFNILLLLQILFTAVSCGNDTLSYAELIDNESKVINDFKEFYGVKAIEIDDEQITNWTNKILNDSVNPSTLIVKDQWYTVTDGNFKRLYFRIKDFGERTEGAFYQNKIGNGSYALIRYQDCYLLNNFNGFNETDATDNLNPYSFQMIYNWNDQYYASPYYGNYNGSNSSYECTSGGLAFPVRFLWFGGEAELIVPFSLVSTEFSSYYYTLYYGSVRYTKPTYIPE